MHILSNAKKLFAAVAAVAIIGFSAFTIASEKTESYTVQTSYWFAMDESGEVPLSGPISNVNTLCPTTGAEPDCARQYSASQTTGTGSARSVLPAEIDNHQSFRSRNN